MPLKCTFQKFTMARFMFYVCYHNFKKDDDDCLIRLQGSSSCHGHMMHGNHAESLSSQALTIHQLGSDMDSVRGVV